MLIVNKAVAVSEDRHGIEIMAPPKCDFFVDSRTGIDKADAPFCYEKATGDFVARAKVRPGFKKTYDAGGIFVLDSAKKWIKFEFELTDLGYPSVVSVVTDGTSDDANGERMDGVEELWLQVVRSGDYWALHHSPDGKKWKMARYFRLKMKSTVRVGLEAQSPVGAGCAVVFSGWKLSPGAVKDLRKGK